MLFAVNNLDIDRGPVFYNDSYIIDEISEISPIDYELLNCKKGLAFLKNITEDALANNFFIASSQEVDWSQLSYFPRLYTPQHGWVDWSWSGHQIFLFCRAFSQPYPGAMSSIDDVDLTLLNVSFVDDQLIHPFCAGLISNVDRKSGFVTILVEGGSLVAHLRLIDNGNLYFPKLGARLFSSYDRLKMSKMSVSYDQNGLKTH